MCAYFCIHVVYHTVVLPPTHKSIHPPSENRLTATDRQAVTRRSQSCNGALPKCPGPAVRPPVKNSTRAGVWEKTRFALSLSMPSSDPENYSPPPLGNRLTATDRQAVACIWLDGNGALPKCRGPAVRPAVKNGSRGWRLGENRVLHTAKPGCRGNVVCPRKAISAVSPFFAFKLRASCSPGPSTTRVPRRDPESPSRVRLP